MTKIVRRELTEEELKMIAIKIDQKVANLVEPTLISGNYHEGVCSIPVINDPPGTGACPPC